MPSEQFKRFMQDHPMGGGMPGMENMPKPQPGELPSMPEGFEMVLLPLPDGFIGELVEANSIKGVRISAPDVKKDQAFMHIHGGGMTAGSALFAIPFLLYLVRTLKIECYSVEYSLAPKYKFPIQINECFNFYKGLLGKGFEKIVIGGESAGALLSIAVTHYIKDNNLRLPAAVIALSPPGDMTVPVGEVYKTDWVVDIKPMVAEVYAGKIDLKNPYLSPVYGDFKNYPPLLLQVGGNESLVVDSIRLAEAAAKADVDVLFHVWKDMGHCFAQEFGNYPEADSAMQEIINFIGDKIKFSD